MTRVLPAVLALVILPAAALAQPATAEPQWLESLRTSRGRLGVEVMELNDELRAFFGAPKGRGVLVARVEDDSPARAAGLEVGDVLQRVDGKDVGSAWDVTSALAGRKKGDKVEVDVVRAKRDLKLFATLARDTRPGWVEQRMLELADPSGHLGPRSAWRRFEEPQQQTERRLEDLERRVEALEKR
jgi:S1-C subfamily serine protease